MKAIEHNTIAGAKQINFAETQDEYTTLPSQVSDDNKVALFVWKLSFRERVKLLFSGLLYHQVLTFGQALQPIRLEVDEPNAFVEVPVPQKAEPIVEYVLKTDSFFKEGTKVARYRSTELDLVLMHITDKDKEYVLLGIRNYEVWKAEDGEYKELLTSGRFGAKNPFLDPPKDPTPAQPYVDYVSLSKDTVAKVEYTAEGKDLTKQVDAVLFPNRDNEQKVDQ